MLPTLLEPVRGLQCPIILDITENAVYLKGCQHYFDRAYIAQYFREKFEQSNFATCPQCRKEYSIIKFLNEGREQAISKLFKRILIVPVVAHEINEKLAEWENCNQQLAERNNQLEIYKQQVVDRNKQLDKKEKQIEKLIATVKGLAIKNEELTALVNAQQKEIASKKIMLGEKDTK